MAQLRFSGTKLRKFAHSFGVVRLARELSVEPSAVYNWLNGRHRPKTATASKIRGLAKKCGVRLTLDEIYQPFEEVESERFTASSLKPQPARA